QHTVDLVQGGKKVRIERRALAELLSIKVLDSPVSTVDSVPVAARIAKSIPLQQADGRGYGFLLDGGRLWALGTKGMTDDAFRDFLLAVCQANASPIVPMEQSLWDSYVRGPDLVQR